MKEIYQVHLHDCRNSSRMIGEFPTLTAARDKAKAAAKFSQYPERSFDGKKEITEGTCYIKWGSYPQSFEEWVSTNSGKPERMSWT